MADDVTTTAGTIAADELNSLNGLATAPPKPKAQRVKLVYGADGEGRDVDPAHGLPVSVVGNKVTVAAEKVRPADTNLYAAKDVFDATVGSGFLFQNLAAQAGGSGWIVKAQLATDQKTNTARYRLHLFNADVTWINDNDPYLSLYANIGARVGSIDFDACATEDPTNSTQATSQRVGALLPFVCAADPHLRGILELLDGFTPASGQRVTIKLTPERD